MFPPGRIGADGLFPVVQGLAGAGGALAQLVTAGVIGGIGLSEVGAETIRRAANVHPIAAVEVECSLWAVDILDNGVAAACSELNIPIVAYCPLGRGFLVRLILAM